MSDPSGSPLLGRTLVGRYTVGAELGRGGMSIVHHADDDRLGRPIALKIIRFPDEIASGERDALRERLRREAASAARIPPHPNVVQIYDYGTDPELDLDFIAMELLRGSDLKQRLRSGGLTMPEARRILTEAARGIAAGHRAGIVHRDVKPANIFLSGDEQIEGVKILDFGIAKAFDTDADLDDDLTRDGRIPHSPAYASPEQLDATRPTTPLSDVYQLGLIGYEMLSGERPFDETERARIRDGEEITPRGNERWAAVPADLRASVERALRTRPADRFESAAEFAAALDGSTATVSAAAAPAPHSSGSDEQTLFAPSPSAAAIPSTQKSTPRGASRLPGAKPIRSPRLALVAGGVAGAAVVAWLAAGMLGSPDQPSTSGFPTVDDAGDGSLTGDRLGELDEEFRDLLIDAFRDIDDEVSADEGEEAAEAVQEVIGELQQSFVRGSIDRHLGYYADRVDFRGEGEIDRDRIGEIRREQIDRYRSREITVDRIAIEFVAPGRARAIVDRRWRFRGDEDVEGSAREELVLVRGDDGWRVVAERELDESEDVV